MKHLIRNYGSSLLVLGMTLASAPVWADDVELLTQPGQTTEASDLIFTVVTGIRIEGDAYFYQQKKTIKQSLLLSPVAQWEQRFNEQYLGFLLPAKNVAGSFQWQGKLKVYFGKIEEGNIGNTQAWPQSERKDRSYQQAIASAKAFKHVSFPASDGTIRFYYAPTKTAWTAPTAAAPEGAYTESDSMLILYVDPKTGDKKEAIFSPSALYSLRTNTKNPQDQTMASIWYRVKAGAIDFTYLEAAQEERGVPVNLYTTQIFVFDNDDGGGYIFGAGEDDPKMEPTAEGDQVKSLDTILKHGKGITVDAETLKQAVTEATELMRSL